jgi:thiol-disulfide isomerase/thioredoxin
MNLANAIEKSYKISLSKGYPKFYIAIDLHDTIMPSTYKKGKFTDFYEDAIKALQYLSSKPNISLILFTSTYEDDIKEFIDKMKLLNIKFDHFNSNPECPNDKLGDYSKKFYYNLILDDRGGFEAWNGDWIILLNKFKELFNEVTLEDFTSIKVTSYCHKCKSMDPKFHDQYKCAVKGRCPGYLSEDLKTLILKNNLITKN